MTRPVEVNAPDRAQLLGSWAGAMGQTKFLTTNYLACAVDAGGDGRRDIWGSVTDVMASIANCVRLKSSCRAPWW